MWFGLEKAFDRVPRNKNVESVRKQKCGQKFDRSNKNIYETTTHYLQTGHTRSSKIRYETRA